jgi:hypothetical protein
MYIADSLIQYDSTLYSRQALQHYTKIKNYHCAVGQWNCQNGPGSDRWVIPLDLKYLPIEDVDSVDLLSRLISYNGDWVTLPLPLELPLYFNNVSVSAHMLGFNTQQKTNLLVDMLKQIDTCQSNHKKVLLQIRESAVNNPTIRKHARKQGKFANELYHAVTSEDYMEYFDDALDLYYSNYKIQFLNQAFVRFTPQGIFNLAFFPGDTLARLDSVHDSYLNLLQNIGETATHPAHLRNSVSHIQEPQYPALRTISGVYTVLIACCLIFK